MLVFCDLDGTAIIGVHMGGIYLLLNITIIYLSYITARFSFHSHSLCCFALIQLETRDKKQ